VSAAQKLKKLKTQEGDLPYGYLYKAALEIAESEERKNTALRAHAERLAEALKDIAETLEAHEVDTLDCDRAGNKFCTCLERRISKADQALTLYRAENPKV